MYGITPNAKMEKVLRPPPVMTFSSSRNPKSFVMVFAPGTTTFVPKENIAKAKTVNNSLRLKSLLVGPKKPFRRLNI